MSFSLRLESWGDDQGVLERPGYYRGVIPAIDNESSEASQGANIDKGLYGATFTRDTGRWRV